MFSLKPKQATNQAESEIYKIIILKPKQFVNLKM